MTTHPVQRCWQAINTRFVAHPNTSLCCTTAHLLKQLVLQVVIPLLSLLLDRKLEAQVVVGE